MKRIWRHIIWMAFMACLAAVPVSCIMDPVMEDEEDMPDTGGTAMLMLHTQVMGATRTGGTNPLPDNELMHTLRIVILHSDGTVEHNRFIDFGTAQTEYTTQIFEVTKSETKYIYLIANEGNVTGLNSALQPFGKQAVDGFAFAPDYTKPIPMSAVYDVEVGEESKLDYQFHLVRAATKFTYRFTNRRDDDVTVNSIAVNDIAQKMYLMAHKKAPYMYWEDEKFFWIDWLKRVSDESQEYPEDGGLANRRGWILDYDIPADAHPGKAVIEAPEGFVVSKQTDEMGVPKPGEAVFPAFFLPESKHLKTPQEAPDGEQAYTMIFNLTDGSGKMVELEAGFNNLKALFRNTHVLVDVTFSKGETSLGLTVDVIPYSEVVLEPEFGLDPDKNKPNPEPVLEP